MFNEGNGEGLCFWEMLFKLYLRICCSLKYVKSVCRVCFNLVKCLLVKCLMMIEYLWIFDEGSLVVNLGGEILYMKR